MESRKLTEGLLGETRLEILEYLLESESTVQQLAKQLRLIEPGVRKHLDYLESLGIVDSLFRNDGVGRPKKNYRITRAGRGLFPKMYDMMLINVVSELAKSDQEYGTEVLSKTLSSIASSIATRFRETYGALSRDLKIKAFEQFLNELGFSSKVGVEKSGEVRITRRDCALYNVALSNHKHVCLDFDTRLVEESLGDNCKVHLESCMALGSAKCQHSVTLIR